MSWKYIVFGAGLMEIPVIFPDRLVHVDVAKAIVRALPRVRVVACKVVSAGMLEFPSLECHGRSETLGIDSRGEEDSRLILMYDYLHGIKGL